MATPQRVLIAQTEFKPSDSSPIAGVTGSGRNGRVLPGDVIETETDAAYRFLRDHNLAVPVADGLRLQRAVLTDDGEDFAHNFTRPEGAPEGVMLMRRGTKGAPPSDTDAEFHVIARDGTVTNTRKGIDSATRAAVELAGSPAVAAEVKAPAPSKPA